MDGEELEALYEVWECLRQRWGREEARDRLAQLMPSTETLREVAAYADEQACRIGAPALEAGVPDLREGSEVYWDFIFGRDDLNEVAEMVESAVSDNINSARADRSGVSGWAS